MSILPTFNTKDRTTVPTPEAIKLFKGLAFLALGIIGLSFFVTELEMLSCYRGGKRDERFRR